MSLTRRFHWVLAVSGLLATVAALLVISSTAAQVGTPTSPAAPSHGGQALPDAGHFVSEVDNKFFPLSPGTTFFFEGKKDGVPTSTEMQVTYQTKQILGVKTTVVHDRAFENGVLAEDTLDWYAQDDKGNVWYFGEDTKKLDPAGNVTSTEGTWTGGVNGAQPGIIMEAHPRVGDRYNQELAPGVAEDKARVIGLHKSSCVRYGCFDDLLLTEESTPLNPGDVEHKYYAEEVGFILGMAVPGGNERTELVRVTRESGDGHDHDSKSGEIDDGKGRLSQASITLAQAIAVAHAVAGGAIGEVDLEDYQGKLVFNIDIGYKDVKVDAHTGAVLSKDSND